MATERLVNNETPALFNALHLFVLGCTLLVYNIHSIAKIIRSRSNGQTANVRFPQAVYFVVGAAGLCMALTGFKVLSWSMIGGCLLLGILSFAYSLPILPFKSRKRLREYGWLKIAALASVWTVVTSILPVLYWHHSIAKFPYEVLLRFAFIFTLCIIFDLRDVRKDAAENIQTLPNTIGLKNSYRLIDVSIIVFMVMSLLQYVRYPVWERLAGSFITAVLTHFVAIYLRKHPTERRYALLGDGLMLVYTGLVFLLP